MELIIFEKDTYWRHMREVKETLGKENAEQLKGVIDKLDQNSSPQQRWIKTAECMKLLGITSKTTLWRLRNGFIRYSKMGKTILYDRESVLDYIERNAKDTFL